MPPLTPMESVALLPTGSTGRDQNWLFQSEFLSQIHMWKEFHGYVKYSTLVCQVNLVKSGYKFYWPEVKSDPELSEWMLPMFMTVQIMSSVFEKVKSSPPGQKCETPQHGVQRADHSEYQINADSVNLSNVLVRRTLVSRAKSGKSCNE